MFAYTVHEYKKSILPNIEKLQKERMGKNHFLRFECYVFRCAVYGTDEVHLIPISCLMWSVSICNFPLSQTHNIHTHTQYTYNTIIPIGIYWTNDKTHILIFRKNALAHRNEGINQFSIFFSSSCLQQLETFSSGTQSFVYTYTCIAVDMNMTSR